MIIEAIYDNEFKGKQYKIGDQKNVIDSLGKFLVEKNQNWKYVKGAKQTNTEIAFHAELNKEEEEAPITKKTKK